LAIHSYFHSQVIAIKSISLLVFEECQGGESSLIF
jgi:hypothetical protein